MMVHYSFEKYSISEVTVKILHYANVIQPLELTRMDLYVYRHIYVCITY